jgi:MYXO-CTERM domain-containing protein
MIRKNVYFVVALAAGLSAQARADTIATFADPALGPSTPLFTWNSVTTQLTGGWSGTGLNLLTPALPAPDFTDATFTMTPLTQTFAFSGIVLLSGGTIKFFDSGATEVLRIDFASAVLSSSLSVGASDLTANNVTFSGSMIPLGWALSDESFAFSFANPVQTSATGAPPSFTVTSAFTSSATIVIPTPGAAALLGLGGLVAVRRRRSL